jgi:hypothetical protein
MRNIVETLNIVKDTFSCLNGVLTLYVWILFADIQDLFFKKYVVVELTGHFNKGL